jgi:hypothetical protein
MTTAWATAGHVTPSTVMKVRLTQIVAGRSPQAIRRLRRVATVNIAMSMPMDELGGSPKPART